MTCKQASEIVGDNSYQIVELGGHEFLAANGNLYKVRVTDGGELAVTETEREKNNYVHIISFGVTSTERMIGVDLSDTTNWPHDFTGRIDLSYLYSQVHISNNATGMLKMGVITRIDGTDADITWLRCYIFDKSSAVDIFYGDNFAPSQLKLGVNESGELTKAVSSLKSTDVTAVNTGITLLSALGTQVIPGKGDLIIELEISSGEADFVVDFMYHSEESI